MATLPRNVMVVFQQTGHRGVDVELVFGTSACSGDIVADSTPEQEYEETMHKAEGLLRAL
jgi:anthranilate/para-aminobenzoate synthase component I